MRRFRPFAEPRWNREVRPCLLRERTHRVQEIYRRRLFANTALGSLGDLRRRVCRGRLSMPGAERCEDAA